LDEEMTNLIQYQQAYEAAARLVTTVSQMMNTVLNLT
jgi:flagellar hook-associated protein 1 FlgK